MSAPDADLRASLEERWVPATLVATTALALLARFYRLGERVMYYDEAWFAYWIPKYVEHGAWEYRATLHGPFYTRLNSVLFPVLGANDFTARLLVALIGGLLPLAAWLFRDRLRDVEVVALALFLAFNPILLYYSRMMRKDLPLAAFMLVAAGFALRAYHTRNQDYLYGAAVAFGLAFTTKESVLLWILCWGGAAGLVLGTYVLRSSDGYAVADLLAPLRSVGRTSWFHLRYWWRYGAYALLIAGAIVVFAYAPRAGDQGGIGLWKALGGEFGTLPAVVGEATVGSFEKAIEHWVGGSKQDHPYIPYFQDTIRTLRAGALGVSVLAVVGYVHDQVTGSRPLVAANFYAGLAAMVGYPYANHFPVPWSTIHAVAPLTIPAAVGAGVCYRWSRNRLPTEERRFLRRLDDLAGRTRSSPPEDRPTRIAGGLVIPAFVPGFVRDLREEYPDAVSGARELLAAGVLVYLAVFAGIAAVQTSYLQPHDSPELSDDGSEVVFYAQAPGELRTVIDAIERSAATGGEGADVLYVGESIAMDESAVEYAPETGAWHRRMPLPWYTEAAGAEVASVHAAAAIESDPPPVVIATPGAAPEVGQRLQGYEREEHMLDGVNDRDVVVFREA